LRLLQNKRLRDYAGGTLMAVIGLGAAFQGSTYNVGTLSRMGPGYFPLALGIILTLIGIAIVVTARFTHYEGEDEALPPEWRGWICICSAVIAFVVFGIYGGLVPATFAIVFISAMGDKMNTWKSAAILSVGMVVVAVVVFWWALQMQLPLFGTR
jgi:hypothetical protein